MAHHLYVHSRKHFDTITTLHAPREYHLRNTVASMKEALESIELYGVKWIDGRTNLSGALTKWKWELAEKLNIMLVSGT